MDMSKLALLSLVVLSALLLLITYSPAVSSNHGGLELTTYFTGVYMKPGESISETLQVTSNLSYPVDVQLSYEAPPGWNVEFKSMGYTVSTLFAPPGQTRSVDMTIKPPAHVAPGTYLVKLLARSRSGSVSVSSNELDIKVNVLPRSNVKPIEVTVSYPSLTGSPGSTLDFTFDVKNNLDRDVTVTLGAVKVPPGWNVVFRPYTYSTTVISGLTIKASSTQYGAVAEVTIPNSATPGMYKLVISISMEGYSVTVPLTATVSGITSYRLFTPSGLLSLHVMAGSMENATLIVSNTGTELLNKITLSSVEPAGWIVRFIPSNVSVLQPGQSMSVTMMVKPPAGSIAGDYMLTVSAFNSKAGSHSLDFRVTVVKQTYWGIIGVVVVVVAVVALLAVFWRFGRP